MGSSETLAFVNLKVRASHGDTFQIPSRTVTCPCHQHLSNSCFLSMWVITKLPYLEAAARPCHLTTYKMRASYGGNLHMPLMTVRCLRHQHLSNSCFLSMGVITKLRRRLLRGLVISQPIKCVLHTGVASTCHWGQ